jgi:hypothetical protein
MIGRIKQRFKCKERILKAPSALKMSHMPKGGMAFVCLDIFTAFKCLSLGLYL